MSLDWQCLMPELSSEPHQLFSMRFTRRDPASFFNASPRNKALCRERRQCLNTAPHRHAALLEPGLPLLNETLRLAAAWDERIPAPDATDPERLLRHLGQVWEPDFLLLKPDSQGVFRLWGGCVCFPSSWALEEKIGLPMEEIHGPVPGLNKALGSRIETFLHSLRPGIAWMRANWGLSRSEALNQHPVLQLPKLETEVPLDQVWLRVEHQALVRLPETNGILFGIRIAPHPLSEVCRDPPIAQSLALQLKVMPEEVARYKNLSQARQTLLHYLQAP